MSQAIVEQHELLSKLTASLKAAHNARRDRAVLIDLLNCMMTYMFVHFAAEDRLMIDSDYPGFGSHQKEHDAALAMTGWFEGACRSGQPWAIDEAIIFLEFWMQDHAQNADRQLEEHLSTRSETAAA